MEKKIGSPEDLKALREKAKREIDLRTGPKEIEITVHMGTCGIASGAREVLNELADELGRASIENLTLRQSGCKGLCDQEPMMTIRTQAGEQFVYGKLNKQKVREIVREHIVGGTPVQGYMLKKP